MRKSMKTVVSMILTMALLFGMVMGGSSVAFAKNESGTAAENLTVNVKYNDETVTKVYSIDDFKKLGLQTARYSYVDALPSVVLAEAQGVYISDILADMNVEYNKSNLKSIKFTSTDSGVQSLSYKGLSGSYYPDLAKAGYEFEDDSFVSADKDAVLATAESVDAMLALATDWRRVSSGKDFDDPFESEQNDDIAFRLMPVADDSIFGTAKSTAAGTLKWIDTMDVTINANLKADDNKPGGNNSGSNKPSGNNNSNNNNQTNENNNNNNAVKIPAISTVKGSLSDLSGHWSENDIYRMVALGAINGNPDGTFAPNGSVTRAEFVTMLMKSMIKTNHGLLEGSNKFADAKGHWAEQYIGAAVEAGIVKGKSDTAFEPNAKITRQEMAVMITNALKFENKEGTASGVDTGKIAAWATNAVDLCNDYGIMTYDGSKMFYPENNATRAESATVLWRAFSTKGYVAE